MAEDKYVDYESIAVNQKNDNSKKQDNEKPVRPEEIHPNAVKGPVVVFFGPESVGKTVVLLRLSHYITESENCRVQPNQNFRTDSEYAQAISTFNELMRSTKLAPERTGKLNFLLIDVAENSKQFCQILEAPGEHFFSPSTPEKKGFLPYLNQIMIHSTYKKIFVLFFEEGMLKNDQARKDYANRVEELLQNIDSNRDKVIFLYNKVDKSTLIMQDGLVNRDDIKKDIFENPNNQSLINYIKKTKGFKNVHFVGFSSGSFTTTTDLQQQWVFSHPRFPKLLWKTIHGCIKPTGWWG